VPVEILAYYRFEDTIPSAYWRHANLYTDHSGHRNHLDFAEQNYGDATEVLARETAQANAHTASNVKYDNARDGNPQVCCWMHWIVVPDLCSRISC
jgi:hypothetical protein